MANQDMACWWNIPLATSKRNSVVILMLQAVLFTNMLFFSFIWDFVYSGGSNHHHAFVGGCNAVEMPKKSSLPSHGDQPVVGSSSLDKSVVTFIVPSKGRESIYRTIESLINQTDDRWEAVIIFDGGEQPESLVANVSYLSDPRIHTYTMPKVGEQNFAAVLRNYGMSKGSSEWLAFVDDDDVLSFEYVARLWEESGLDPLVETIIFRMSGIYSGKLCIYPPESHAMFQLHYVGISFAVKRSVFEAGYWFQPSITEDFEMLKTIFDAQKKMVISPYVTYHVRNERPIDANVSYPRFYINQ